MSETLTLEYNLAELPSSQHRAGLAGLVLMVKWLQKEPEMKGVCQISSLNEVSTSLKIDQEGLQFLFDKIYAAAEEEIEQKNKYQNKEPIREVEREVTDKKGNTKTKTFYVYPKVVPHGAFLFDYDRSEERIWIKLWRDMIWSILRGNPQTRGPYEERSKGNSTDDVEKVWKELNKKADYTVDLPSTYFIGAQAKNAENVPFKDIARFQFLLHFWAFVVQIYVPKEWKYDRKTKTEKPKDVGYALVIPDVAKLETFCDELTGILKSRGNEVFGYRPKESVVDIAAEGALDLMHKINQRLASKVSQQVGDLLLGVDVVHLEKQGNNIRLWGNTRVDPAFLMIDKYALAKDRFKHQLFRKQRILNVLNEKDWFYGFDSLLSKTDIELTISNSYFRSDARRAFEDIGVINRSKGVYSMDEQIKDKDTQAEEKIPKTIEEIVYSLVRTYISAKLKSKYQLEWKESYKKTPKENDYNEKKRKVVRDAFFAIRSRTEDDFIDYFASSLCAFPQFLNEQGYATLAKALHEETDKVRTLTMLALSARG